MFMVTWELLVAPTDHFVFRKGYYVFAFCICFLVLLAVSLMRRE